MANQTVSASANGDAASLSGLANGENYTIQSGATLTIDSDSRWGQQAAVIGNVTLSATSGGTFLVDGRNTWWMAYTGGTGNVPALGTVGTNDITGGIAGRGEFLGVWTAIPGAPVAAAAAMPASGFIKMRRTTVAFVNGEVMTLTGGATATVNSATGGVRGWLSVVGAELATITVPRLGLCQMLGDLFLIGTTNGVDDQTMNYYTADRAPALYVETGSGTGVYDIWLNAGTTRWGQAADRVATDARGKLFYCDGAGLITFARRTSNQCGYKPPTGCRVYAPNIHISSSTSADWTANVKPNVTLATRWDFTTSSGGAIDISKVATSGDVNLASPYSVTLNELFSLDEIRVTTPATALVMTKCAVGLSDNNVNVPMNITNAFAGLTMTDCVTIRYSGGQGLLISDCIGVTVTRGVYMTFGNATAGTLTRANATDTTLVIQRVVNGTITNPTCVGAPLSVTSSTDVTLTDVVYSDALEGRTTNTTNPCSAVSISVSCLRVKLIGFTHSYCGVANTQSYNSIVVIDTSNSITLESIGTPASPLDCGSSNASAALLQMAGSGLFDCVIRRLYAINTRTTVLLASNNARNVIYQDCWGDGGDAWTYNGFSAVAKGFKATNAVVGSTSVYGCHFFNTWTSTTAGVICFQMNEPTSDTASKCAATGGTPQFTSSGTLVLDNVGDQVTWTMDYFVRGALSFTNSNPTFTGTNSGNHTLEYQIDTGSGWNGTWKTATGANLSAETIPAYVDETNVGGFKLKFRATCATASTSNLITTITIPLTTDATTQQRQYPRATPTVKYTSAATGSLLAVFNATGGLLATGAEASGTATTNPAWDADYTATLRLRRGGYLPVEATSTIVEGGVTLVAAQTDWATVPNTDPGALGITVTNHGASPVSWQSKSWSITITTTDDTLTATQVAQYISWNIAQAATFNGSRGPAWPTMVIPSGSEFETAYGTLMGSAGATLKGVRVVRNDGTTPHSGFTQMQADDGTYYVRPATLAIIDAAILTGSRVQLYNVTTAAEIENRVLSGAGYSYSTTNGVGITIGNTLRLRVTKLGYDGLQLSGVAGSSGVTWIDVQVVDAVYVANGVDGSTVTEFTGDYPNVQVDVSDPDQTTTVQRLYAWWTYNLTTASGIANFYGGMIAEDVVNYKIKTALLSLKLDNTAGTPVRISGGRLYRDDGTTVIATASGSIQMDPDKAYLAGGGAIFDATLEGSTTVAQGLRLMLAHAAGDATGLGATGVSSAVFKSRDGTKNRIQGTLNNGARTITAVDVT